MNEIQERMAEILSSCKNLFDREEVCRKTLLALASEESVFLYGPPGTAKSMVAKWVAQILDTKKYFSCLLNQYTQPDELFGPVSIQALEKGTREILTEGYMPDSEIAFLDEIWKAGPAILNTLLTICNEKTFKNGNRTVSVPLKLLMSASNEFPGEDSGLEPLYDRFLIRMCINPIARKDSFVSMITGKTKSGGADFRAITAEELESWRNGSAETEVPKEITDFLYTLRLRLNERDIYVSDRRWKKIVNLLRTSAFLNGRKKVGYSDLFIIEDAIWSRPEERDVIRECASESVTGETIRGSFSFVERITNEVIEMRSMEITDTKSYQSLAEKIDGETTYLNTLKRELEIARGGGENFWKNVFSGLSNEFEREMMNRGIERLREFITDAEGILESLRYSKKATITHHEQLSKPTVILNDAEAQAEKAQHRGERDGRFGEGSHEAKKEPHEEKQVMSIKEMQDESFRRIQETLSMNLDDSGTNTVAEETGYASAQENHAEQYVTENAAGNPQIANSQITNTQTENPLIGTPHENPQTPNPNSQSENSSVANPTANPSANSNPQAEIPQTENQRIQNPEISNSEIANPAAGNLPVQNQNPPAGNPMAANPENANPENAAQNQPHEIQHVLPQNAGTAESTDAAETAEGSLGENENADENAKEIDREKIKEQIQQAIRRNQVEEQSRNIIQQGISRLIKAFVPERAHSASENIQGESGSSGKIQLAQAIANNSDSTDSTDEEKSEIEELKENTARMRQELTQMSHINAEVSDDGADDGERSAYETKLSTTKTFAEFVEMSHYKYLGDSSDRRYKWNENSNNGAKWWNVGSRFYQMLDGDRNTLSAIEAECAKRGAKIGGKYHWVFSVCYIFEKNDGIYDWKTRAELRWLLGNAWRFLEPVFNEALL